MPLTSRLPRGTMFPEIRPAKPRRMPTTSQPLSIPVRTTARMAPFIPGASPPLVRTAIRFMVLRLVSSSCPQERRQDSPQVVGAHKVDPLHAQRPGHRHMSFHIINQDDSFSRDRGPVQGFLEDLNRRLLEPDFVREDPLIEGPENRKPSEGIFEVKGV